MRLASILVFFTFILSGQERSNVFTLKPSVGVNGCQIHGDSYAGYDKVGLFCGIAVNGKTANDKTSFELGFYFSQKGSRHNPTKNDGSYYRLHLNYIDIPLSLRYRVNSNYFITLGPSIAYLINYNENRDYVDYTGRYIYNKLEAGVNIGLGRKIMNNLSVEIRCSNSVTPVRRIIAPIYYPNPVARFFNKGFYSNILSFFLTYQLDFNNTAKSGEE